MAWPGAPRLVQIRRGAGPDRLAPVVDFRRFGYVKPEKQNCVMFSEKIVDGYGMLQVRFPAGASCASRCRLTVILKPTFSFKINNDAKRCNEMIIE